VILSLIRCSVSFTADPTAASRGSSAHSQIGTALYREYLRRLFPLLPAMREQIAEPPMAPPDLLEISSRVLRDLMAGCLERPPEWMVPVTNNERLAMNDRPFTRPAK
jgi:hypothetical protein